MICGQRSNAKHSSVLQAFYHITLVLRKKKLFKYKNIPQRMFPLLFKRKQQDLSSHFFYYKNKYPF